MTNDTDIKDIANKYNLTAGQIKDIVGTAGTYALWRDMNNAVITQKDIETACHEHSNQKLSRLAVRVKPKHRWDDLILEDAVKNKLKNLVSMFQHKHVVFDDWGFENKLSLGKGISALFYGEPGTGKTLAAEIIANELTMDMYRVDLASTISKYVGETEKNLDIIFNEAQASNCILFFDEADAMFGKRTEIKDAHDRYANVEVSYLLQKIDEYRGIVIMATNFSSNLDPAFERRLHFSIKFPFPDEQCRLLIWKNIFPKQTPLDENIDFEFLAKKFIISGGNIKNIALASAFYAAESNSKEIKVNMSHIIKACKSEFEKIGRLWDNQLDIN
jgi:SpoVK/Ycf46/Vps4 family AAA+-type ATPase